MLPSLSVLEGEKRIANIYDTLRGEEAAWRQCLFVSLYDEHGGFYDQVPPPAAVVADAIERLHADRLVEHVERLAHHARQGEVWDKAVRYLRQAGAKVLLRSANRGAADYLEQALDAFGRLPETPASIAESLDLRFDLRHALLPPRRAETDGGHPRRGRSPRGGRRRRGAPRPRAELQGHPVHTGRRLRRGAPGRASRPCHRRVADGHRHPGGRPRIRD